MEMTPKGCVLLLVHVAVEKGVDPAYIKLDHSQLYQSASSEIYFSLTNSKMDYVRQWKIHEKDEVIKHYFDNLAHDNPTIEAWTKFPTEDQKHGFVNIEENLDIALSMLNLAKVREKHMVEHWCSRFFDSMEILSEIKRKDEADSDEAHTRFMLKEFAKYKNDEFSRFNFFYDAKDSKTQHSIYLPEGDDTNPTRIDITNLIYLLEAEQITPVVFDRHRESIPYLVVFPTNRTYY